MKNKTIAAMLGAVMIFTLLFTVIPPVFAVQNTIDISSKKDFIEFSKNCTLDTWSQGKTVNLTCDIDFKGADFSPVPTFGGTFNGNGYTISGIKFHKSGSYIGVFRYIQPEGKITNLNVKAEFAPNGSKCFIGGIVGENHGVLEMCGFDGTVKGQDVIGGIAGNNAEDGQIISGIAGGSIIGENSTGGIAGKNSGFIQNCTNNAAVNTVYEEKKKDISDIDADTGAIIENYKNKAEESEEETILGNSDTGGIVGYSSGIIQGCVNNSGVGYRHIGYNIGGIAGRQSGYMLGCRNYGSVQGRKDVGGIVGQLEPYVLLNVSEGGLKNIRKELNDLNTMVNRFLTDTDNLGTDTEKHLSDISEYSKNARDNAEIMLNQGTGFIDDNIGEINAQSAILSNSFDKLAPVFESLTNSFDDLASAVDETIKSVDDLETDLPDLSDEHELIKSALRDISRSADSIKKSLSKADKACGDLDDAIKFNNETQARNSVSELQNSLKDIITSKQTIKASLEAIESALRSGPANSESALKQIAESIKTIKENADTEISSLQQIVTNLDDIKNNSETDLSKFGSAARNMKSALQNLGDGLYLLSRGLEKISESAEGIYNKSGSLSEEFQTANENLKKSLKSASYACGDIASATGDIKDIVTDLSDEKPAEFVKLGDDFKTASDGLFNSLSDISDELNKLKNSVSKERNTVVNDLRSVGNQFNLVMNLLIGEFENLQSGTKNASDIFLDVSDEDIENTKQGKAEECHNYGDVTADRSVGGIAGAMAIEYAKDPEDDIKKPDSLNFTFRTKAILKRCINEGEVTGKKDCAGGIAGLSEIGTIYECQNYADTESTGGDFVGGIAGKSESSIHQSYAKGKVTGKRYIGGIAGKADTVTGCYTIVDVIGDENTGAISGDAENKDKIYRNYYVDSGLGGIDGISYNGKAMPVAFEDLKDIGGVPARFICFTVTFIADDKIVKTQDIGYGEDTARIKYPEIPIKDGYFGNWQKYEAETVTEDIKVLCEYKPYITILESEEKSENGKTALALCEGEFTDKAELHIKDGKQKPPANTIGNIKVYDISLINTGVSDNETVKTRLLNENKDKVTAWILKNGKWEKAGITYRGKYVILETKGTNSTVCLKYEKRELKIFWLITIAVIVLLIAFAVLKMESKKSAMKE